MRGMEASSLPRPNTKEVLQQIARSRESSATPTPPNGTVSSIRGLEAKPRKVAFAPNASILLIGVRGVGKSSLGFLAATAYSRRLIESDRAFSEAAGATRTEYRKLQGEWAKRVSLFRTVLKIDSCRHCGIPSKTLRSSQTATRRIWREFCACLQLRRSRKRWCSDHSRLCPVASCYICHSRRFWHSKLHSCLVGRKDSGSHPG